MELQIWEGDWGLPSVDHNCLAVLAYCKFANVAVEIKEFGNPWKSPSGEFPVLSHPGGVETKVRDIFNFLQVQTIGSDHDLTAREKADNVAFASLLEEKLHPALIYLWWVDTKSYVEFTRPWHANRLPIPLSWYFPLHKRNEAVARMEAMRGREYLTEAEHEVKLMKDAKECLNLLSAKLGEKQYFHGDKATLLDAQAFGYLALLLNAPLLNVGLQNHLKACRNLVQFCQRILDAHFPLSPEEQEKQRKLAEEARQKMAEDTEFPNKRRNMVIAAAVVIGAMVGYAILNGLIQLEFVDVDQKVQNHPSANVTHVIDEKEEGSESPE